MAGSAIYADLIQTYTNEIEDNRTHMLTNLSGPEATVIDARGALEQAGYSVYMRPYPWELDLDEGDAFLSVVGDHWNLEPIVEEFGWHHRAVVSSFEPGRIMPGVRVGGNC